MSDIEDTPDITPLQNLMREIGRKQIDEAHAAGVQSGLAQIHEMFSVLANRAIISCAHHGTDNALRSTASELARILEQLKSVTNNEMLEITQDEVNAIESKFWKLQNVFIETVFRTPALLDKTSLPLFSLLYASGVMGKATRKTPGTYPEPIHSPQKQPSL